MLQYNVILMLLLAPVKILGVEDAMLRGLLHADLWSAPTSSFSEIERYDQRSKRSRFDGDPGITQQVQQILPKEIIAKLKQNTITVAVVCVSLLLLAAWSLRGFGRGGNGMRAHKSDSAEPLGRDQINTSNTPEVKPQRLSMFNMTMLTCWKFWVGFLTATWMPFLMAKEGVVLWPARQSVFMGAGKLIYGTSILLNPVFGLISDQTKVASRWSGRRLWLIIGVALSAMGVTTVKAASSFQDATSYLVAVALWLLGEAIADTTTETLVPEMVPPEQYDVASGIRSLMFLCGGLCGYVSLIIFRDWDFHWLYPAYLILMLCCAFPTVACIREEEKSSVPVSEEKTIMNSLFEAYIGPLHKYGSGFARACGIQFVFSLGLAPIFFTMLMVRDVCGVHGEAAQQTHFSAVSMLFMLAAAISSVTAAWLAENMKNMHLGAVHMSRKVLLLFSMVIFGLATLMLPITYHIGSESQRLCWFYFTGILLGFSFGSVYAFFQSCMWTLLPSNTSDVANAMGFATLCKCVGVGLGNFAAGFILDSFSMGPQKYAIGGYWCMSVACSVLALASASLGYGVQGLD